MLSSCLPMPDNILYRFVLRIPIPALSLCYIPLLLYSLCSYLLLLPLLHLSQLYCLLLLRSCFLSHSSSLLPLRSRSSSLPAHLPIPPHSCLSSLFPLPVRSSLCYLWLSFHSLHMPVNLSCLKQKTKPQLYL